MDRVLRVLIVEDDEELAGTLRKVLSRAGYSATMANTAREGWETLQHGRFDAVVLDMKTGDIGLGERYAEYPGLYVLDNAAQLEQPPKVVVLTGYPALDTAVDALAGGARAKAHAYMTKEDITPERVVKAISDATGKIQAGTLLIDLEETAAWLNGRPLEIEPQAFALLVVMARKPGHWFDYMDFTRIIDGQIFEMAEASRKWRTHMHRLRTALQEANNGTEYLRNKTGERKRAYFSIRP